MPLNASFQPAVATDFRFAGRSERAVGANGEINASSKRDLLQNSLNLLQASASGQVVTEADAAQMEAVRNQNRELMAAAMSDDTHRRIVGEKLADNIYVTANRKGNMRRFLAKQTLKQGEIPRFPVRMKNVQAAITTGPTKVTTSIATDRYLMPPEFLIDTRLIVPQLELNQSTGDTLESKYVEGLEAIMVTEDRAMYNMMRAVEGVDNSRQVTWSNLSPNFLMKVRQQIERWGLKSMYCWMANDLFVDIVSNQGFIDALELIAIHELVMTGRIANLYGMTLVSESYRHPEHKILSEGEFFITCDADQLGMYSDRGGIKSDPIDGTTEGIIGKGWLIVESMSMAIANSRGVASGQRR